MRVCVMQIQDKNPHALNYSSHETDSLFMHDSQEFLVQQIRLNRVESLYYTNLCICKLNCDESNMYKTHYIHYLQCNS